MRPPTTLFYCYNIYGNVWTRSNGFDSYAMKCSCLDMQNFIYQTLLLTIDRENYGLITHSNKTDDCILIREQSTCFVATKRDLILYRDSHATTIILKNVRISSNISCKSLLIQSYLWSELWGLFSTQSVSTWDNTILWHYESLDPNASYQKIVLYLSQDQKVFEKFELRPVFT